MRAAGALLLLPLALLEAAPGRHLNYAESGNRLVYAFVFGSTDTCRVIRRPAAPAFTLEDMLRRPPGPPTGASPPTPSCSSSPSAGGGVPST